MTSIYKPAREIAFAIVSIFLCLPYAIMFPWYITLIPVLIVFYCLCEFYDEVSSIKFPQRHSFLPQPEGVCVVMRTPGGKGILIDERLFVEKEVQKIIEPSASIEAFDYFLALRELIFKNHLLVTRYRNDVRIIMPSYAFEYMRRQSFMHGHYDLHHFTEFEGIKISFEGYEHKIVLYHVDYAYCKLPWMMNVVALPMNIQPNGEEIPPGGFMSMEAEIKIRLHERNKAVSIAYEFHEKYKQSFKYKEAAGNSVAYVDREIADVCRQVGNAISGHNALSVALKVSDEEIIKQELKREKAKIK